MSNKIENDTKDTCLRHNLTIYSLFYAKNDEFRWNYFECNQCKCQIDRVAFAWGIELVHGSQVEKWLYRLPKMPNRARDDAVFILNRHDFHKGRMMIMQKTQLKEEVKKIAGRRMNERERMKKKCTWVMGAKREGNSIGFDWSKCVVDIDKLKLNFFFIWPIPKPLSVGCIQFSISRWNRIHMAIIQ